MAESQQHLNNSIICAIDTETTGLLPGYHEIVELAIVALDNTYKPREDVRPFHVFCTPSYPERVDQEALNINKRTLADIMTRGFPMHKVVDMFDTWCNELNIKTNKYGARTAKIIPLGHNYAFDQAFIKEAFGKETYEHWIHYHFRDSMVAALYLNDAMAMKGEPVPYAKVNLQYLKGKLGIRSPEHLAHTALQDALDAANCYKRMLLTNGDPRTLL